MIYEEHIKEVIHIHTEVSNIRPHQNKKRDRIKGSKAVFPRESPLFMVRAFVSSSEKYK